MAAFLVWVDDASSDLVQNLDQAYRLLGSGLAALAEASDGSYRRLGGGGRLGARALKSHARMHATQIPTPRADSSARRSAA